MMTNFVASITAAATFGQLDYAIVTVAVVMLFVISFVFGREERNTNDFFVGGRRIPTPVACLSFVATEISALTIVAFPATAYSENWLFMQFFLGMAIARILVAFLFIPAFYKYNCVSIYEFLRYRFGPETQYASSIFFFFMRLISSGVRLYATCLAVGIIMDWTLANTILLFTIVSIAFIAFGGIKAVVWAGAYQAICFVIAGVALVIYLLNHIDGSVGQIWQVAQEAGRLEIFDFAFNLNEPKTFWGGTASGLFIGLVAFGTDQEMVQRLLTVKTRKLSQRAIISTIFSVLPIYGLYLIVGTLLFVFFKQTPNILLPSESKEVLPHFVTVALPAGMKGLVLGAIIMASIDSPLSSLCSSFVTDIYRPIFRKNASEKHYLLVSRAGIVVFGAILAILALQCKSVENILWFAYQIVSVTGGALLGVFLLGLVTKRKAGWANIPAMITSTVVSMVLMLLIKGDRIHLGWSWVIVIGTAITFGMSYMLGPIMKGGREISLTT
jgi:SSS family transporter